MKQKSVCSTKKTCVPDPTQDFSDSPRLPARLLAPQQARGISLESCVLGNSRTRVSLVGRILTRDQLKRLSP